MLTSADNFMASIDALQADPNVDMVLVQEGLPRAPGADRAEHYIRLADDYAATKAKKPIAFVTPISHGQTDYSRAMRAKAPHVSFLQEAYKALRAIASVARREERERLAHAPLPACRPRRRPSNARCSSGCERGARPNRSRSMKRNRKKCCALTASPPRRRRWSLRRDGGDRGRRRIGYPVVLKAVSATLAAQVRGRRGGARSRDARAADAPPMSAWRSDLNEHRLAGMLVCRQIHGGQELVLGLHRDPEMGLVVMAGSGGVLLELIKDVAFCAPPVSREKARDLLARLRGGKLLRAIAARPRSMPTRSSMPWSRSAASPSTSRTSSSPSTSILSWRCRRADWRSTP